MKNWFVAETIRNRQDEAALSVAEYGMEAYVPCILRYRKVGHHMAEVKEPRFWNYIFIRFDRDNDPWQELLRGYGPNRAYFEQILSDIDESDPWRRKRPTPVPDREMKAIMDFIPPHIGEPVPHEYKPNDPVTWVLGGTRRGGVFVGYRGNLPMIRTHIFGAERVCPVSTAEIEPRDIDNVQKNTA